MGIENAYKFCVPQEVLDRKAEIFNLFEGTTCWRCGGSGRYSFNMKDADLCYGCGGSGHQFSTVGRHAFDSYRADRITKVVANSLKKGDCIEWDEVMVEACTSRTVQSRIVSKRSNKKNGMTTLTFHNRTGNYSWGSDMMMDKINLEVRMKDYATNNEVMNNIIQVSLAETREIEFDETDIVLFTAAKVPNNLPAQWIVAEALMPGKKELSLYFKTGWKGKQNPNFDPDWYAKYTPMYMETINNDRSKKWLAQIVKRASEGRRVYLVCYCGNKTWCHTSLIKNACYDILKNR
jgi:hypothetical protein